MDTVSTTIQGDYFLQQFLSEFPRALAILSIPVLLLYFTIYAFVKDRYTLSVFLSVPTLALFWLSPYAAPIHCGAARALLNFAIGAGTMKLLDVLARRDNFPQYTSGSRPPDLIYTMIILTELRYESFTPNQIRIPAHLETFSEPLQLVLHTVAFAVLQTLPQIPPILSYEILIAIYIIWTSMQLFLRYKSSPALFGPLYLADSFAGFWTETWHNAFTAPCKSLAYSPTYRTVLWLGLPKAAARSGGVFASFALMAVFHMYALAPLLSHEGLKRIGLFFIGNGLLTVVEVIVWGRKRHWVRALAAWIIETAFASWVVMAIPFAHGLMELNWREICRPKDYL